MFFIYYIKHNNLGESSDDSSDEVSDEILDESSDEILDESSDEILDESSDENDNVVPPSPDARNLKVCLKYGFQA